MKSAVSNTKHFLPVVSTCTLNVFQNQDTSANMSKIEDFSVKYAKKTSILFNCKN